MGYISGDYESKTYTSFSHSVSSIINSIIKSDMDITLFREYDYDVGLSEPATPGLTSRLLWSLINGIQQFC